MILRTFHVQDFGEDHSLTPAAIIADSSRQNQNIDAIGEKAWDIQSSTIANTLRLFSNASIECLLLKGAMMNSLYGRSYSFRAMRDADICVRRESATDAMKILLGNQYAPRFEHFALKEDRSPFDYIEYRHALAFKAPNSAVTIDLHWHPFRSYLNESLDRTLWENSEAGTFKDIAVKFPSVSDRLFHTIIHGLEWKVVPSSNWIIDAMIILKEHQSQICWQRLQTLAGLYSSRPALASALEFLRDHFEAEIPLLRNSYNSQSSKIDSVEHWLKCSPVNTPLFGNLPYVLFQYRHAAPPKTLSRRGIIGYLRYTLKAAKFAWGVDSIMELPLLFWHKVANKR